MTNPMENIKTVKDGWDYFLSVFRDVIPKGDEYKFKGAYYAGAATYDAILFNKINAAADSTESDEVHLNITDHIFTLHAEVMEFAKKRIETSEAAISAINMGNQRN